MRCLKLCYIFGLVFFAVTSFASDFWVAGQTNIILNDNNDVAQQYDTSFKLQGGYKWVYVWGSMDSTNSMEWGGQPGPDYRLGAIGGGVRVPFLDYFSVYGEFGRYFIGGQDTGWQARAPGTAWEGIFADMGKQAGIGIDRIPMFDNYRNTFYDTWGLEVGAQVAYPLWFGFIGTAQVGYRFLQAEKKQQAVFGAPRETTPDWQFHSNVDMDAWVVGVGLRYEF